MRPIPARLAELFPTRAAIAVLVAIAFPSAPAEADVKQTDYSVRILGIKVGNFYLAENLGDRNYAVTALFRTSGLAEVMTPAFFEMKAHGTRSGERLVTNRYTENMNTERRKSRGTVTWRGNARPVLDGSRAQDQERSLRKNRPLVATADIVGSMDPVTALYSVFRDQPRNSLCKVDQKIFDGVRLGRIVLESRRDDGDTVICDGAYHRIGGYRDDELAERSSFPVSVTYRPEGNAMALHEARIETTYGSGRINLDN